MIPPPAPFFSTAGTSRWVRASVVVLILSVAVYGIDRLICFVTTPQTGIYGGFGSGGYRIFKLIDVQTRDPLEVGQSITAIDGVPVSRWFQSLLRLPPYPGPDWSIDRPILISVVDRQGAVRTIQLTLRPFSGKDLLGPFWIWFLAWVILLFGAYLFYSNPELTRVKLLSFLLLAAALSIFNHAGRHLAIDFGPRLPLVIIIRFTTLAFIFSSWLYLILIFLSLREQRLLPTWVPWTVYLLPSVPVLGLFFFIGIEGIAGFERTLRILYLIAGGVVAFTVSILIQSYYKSRDAVLRAQIKWLLWGHLIGMSPYVCLYVLPLALAGVPLIPYSLSLAPLPVILFSYFFAFYRYRLMEVDRVIEGSLVYGLSALLLSLGYLGALWLFKENLLFSLGIHDWIRSDLLILIGLVFVFNPLKNKVQQGIDRTLFPERIQLPERFLELSTQIARASSLNEIAGVLLEALPEKLTVDRGALLLRRPDRNAWELIQKPKDWLRIGELSLSALETLEKNEPLKPFWDLMSMDQPLPKTDPFSLLKNQGVAALFTLKTLDDLWGFYLLSEKRTHLLFNEKEVNFIVSLVTQAAHLVGNARLLDGLERTHHSLRELNKRLMETEPMATLGEGAAVLAHELKNPLGIIRGSAEILLKDQKSSEHSEILHFIVDETDRLSALVNEFLHFARMAPPQKTETDLNDLVQSVAYLWDSRRDSPLRLAIRFQLNLSPGKVLLDSRQVYQVLLNLFSNAEEAMPGGGELWLSTGRDPNSRLAWASIRDSGKGIPSKDLSRVFDRFFTTKESGLGLGLALSKKVMEAHGGSIRIESTEGEGTRVILFFPVDGNSHPIETSPTSSPERS